MFIDIGRGARLGQATRRALIFSNVTSTGAAPAPNGAACVADGAAGGAGDGGGGDGTAPGVGAPAGY